MPKRLTNQQIHDRCEVYEELLRHLGLTWTDDAGEKREAKIVERQIERLRMAVIMKLQDPA